MRTTKKPGAMRTSGLTILLLLLLSLSGGCKKDSGPTGPFDPPALPTVAGHWSGAGSAFDMGLARRLNFAWSADFGATQTDNSFKGRMVSTCTEQNIYYSGDQVACGVKGRFTSSKQATVVDTSAVYTHQGVSITTTDTRYFTTYEGCTLSSNSDTLSYSGPSPAFETYVLIKQK